MSICPESAKFARGRLGSGGIETCVWCVFPFTPHPSIPPGDVQKNQLHLVARIHRWETVMRSTELCHRRRKERWQQGNGEAAPASLMRGRTWNWPSVCLVWTPEFGQDLTGRVYKPEFVSL